MKDKLTCVLFFGTVFVLAALSVILPRADFSESERRVLASFPEVSAENIFSGKFSADFEEFSTDTFPFRDSFRAIKAFSVKNIFLQSDNNKLISENGHLSKLDYPLNEDMLSHAAGKFSYIYDNFLKGNAADIKLSIIPDKNFYLDTLKYDYSALFSYMQENMPFAEYVDITDKLALSDYYFTDSHWKQEEIVDVANTLLSAFGKGEVGKVQENTLDAPFYGVWCGQAADFSVSDRLTYLTNDVIDSLIVTSFDTGKPVTVDVYDMEKANGRDGYEMFVSGNSSVTTVENPKNRGGGHLVVFRDSFGGAIAPLLAGGYEKVTLVDIRYIPSSAIGSFVDFAGADVLFLYSTGMLNASTGLR